MVEPPDAHPSSCTCATCNQIRRERVEREQRVDCPLCSGMRQYYKIHPVDTREDRDRYYRHITKCWLCAGSGKVSKEYAERRLAAKRLEVELDRQRQDEATQSIVASEESRLKRRDDPELRDLLAKAEGASKDAPGREDLQAREQAKSASAQRFQHDAQARLNAIGSQPRTTPGSSSPSSRVPQEVDHILRKAGPKRGALSFLFLTRLGWVVIAMMLLSAFCVFELINGEPYMTQAFVEDARTFVDDVLENLDGELSDNSNLGGGGTGQVTGGSDLGPSEPGEVALLVSPATPTPTRAPTHTPWPTVTRPPKSFPYPGRFRHYPGEAPLNPRAIEEAVLRYTNDARVQHGLKPYEHDPEIDDIARQHSNNMIVHGAYHELQGRDPTGRARAAGYGCVVFGSMYHGLAENIFKYPRVQLWMGYFGSKGWAEEYIRTEDDMGRLLVEGWMDSPGHRANILDRDYNRLGVGIAIQYEDVGSLYEETIYATQNFSPCE